MTDNPYRPGAAHAPPYLAGRSAEQREFSRLLTQTRILENLALTGIRGVGKTVLLRNELHREAMRRDWLWVTSDISESVSVSEAHLVTRLLTDLNTFSGDWEYAAGERHPFGFTGRPERRPIHFNFETMQALFEQEPGLASDKLKRVLRIAWELMRRHQPGKKGIVFAWDEAQNLADRSRDKQYPLSLLLDVFSSLQSQGAPFMLLLTGLPTLFPKLVAARTFAERMFRALTMRNLTRDESREAVIKPLAQEPAHIQDAFADIFDMIYARTQGYPYFIQFCCRELYDYLAGASPPTDEERERLLRRIARKLDMDFFEGRWAQLTDRQRDLLCVIADLKSRAGEFTVREIVAASKTAERNFSNSHANQMLTALFNKGLVFKNRHGKYALAVPLLDEYIRRRMRDAN